MDETIKPKVEYSEFRRMLEQMRSNKQNAAQDTNNELTNNIRELVIVTKELAKTISKIISAQRSSPMGKPRAAAILENNNNPKIQSDEDQTERIKREDEQTELLRIIARNTGGDKKFKPEKPPQEEGLNFGGLGIFAAAAGAIAGLAMAWVKTVKFFMTAFGKGIQILGETFPVITKVITTIKTAVTGFLQPLITGFQALASSGGFIGKSIQFMQKAIGGFVEFFAGLGSKLGMFGKIFGAVSKVVSKIAYPLMIILTLWDTVKGALKGFEEGGLVGAIGGAIKGFFNSLIFGVLDMFKGAISWIAGALGFKQVEKFLDSFSFEDMFSSFVDAVLFIPQQIQNFIMHPIDSLKKLGTVISDTFSKIVDVFDPVIEFFSGIGKSVVGMLEGIGIPEIGFTIPVIGKKVSIGPFYPFKSDSQKPVAPPSADAGQQTKTPPETATVQQPKQQRTTPVDIQFSEMQFAKNDTANYKNFNKDREALTEEYAKKQASKYGRKEANDMDYDIARTMANKDTVIKYRKEIEAAGAGKVSGGEPIAAATAKNVPATQTATATGTKAGPNWTAALRDYDGSTPADHLKLQYPGIDKKFVELAKKNPPKSDSLQSIEIHEKMLVTMALGEMERDKTKASPIVAKTPTPIPGGGQTVDPSAQNYNAVAAGTQPKAPEKASPIVEGKAGPNWTATLRDYSSSTPADYLENQYPGISKKFVELAKGSKPRADNMQSIQSHEQMLITKAIGEVSRGTPESSRQLAPQVTTGNIIEAKTGDVADSRDSLSTRGGAGTAIVNAPTTVNNTSQTAAFAKSPFRNEEGTINKYYSTRLGAY